MLFVFIYFFWNVILSVQHNKGGMIWRGLLFTACVKAISEFPTRQEQAHLPKINHSTYMPPSRPIRRSEKHLFLVTIYFDLQIKTKPLKIEFLTPFLVSYIDFFCQWCYKRLLPWWPSRCNGKEGWVLFSCSTGKRRRSKGANGTVFSLKDWGPLTHFFF